MIEIKAYECEYCKKKVLRSKSGMYKHEKRCFWNLEVKACMTCEHYIQGGHYAPHCEYDSKNKMYEYGNGIMKPTIVHLQHHCELYKHDGLTKEQRDRQTDEANSDAQADWDEYHASLGV